MNEKIDALVLRAVDYRESDKILTILTRDRGRITVKASGARRKGSRLASCSQPLCYSEMIVFEHSGKYTLDEAAVKEQFFGLTRDVEKMALGSYFAQVLMNEPEEAPGGDEVFRLALNSLYALERNLASADEVKAGFEIRYLALEGYAPNVVYCAKCGKMLDDGFVSLESGLSVCRSCLKHPGDGDMFLDRGAMRAARYIMTCDIKKLFSFHLPEKSMARLGRFSEKYLIARTEQGYKSLDLYHSLCAAAYGQDGEHR